LIQTGDVQAGLVATAAGAPTITGPGTASIKASTGGVEVEIAGTIIDAGGGANGIGFSGIVNDVNRSVVAFIGADPSHPQTTAAGQVSLGVGNLDVGATTGGVWVDVVGTATVLSGPKEVPNEPPPPPPPAPEGSEDDPLESIRFLFDEEPE